MLLEGYCCLLQRVKPEEGFFEHSASVKMAAAEMAQQLLSRLLLKLSLSDLPIVSMPLL